MERLGISNWVWKKGYIKETVLNLNVTKINIITAFFSNYGLILIKELKNNNNLPKDKINIYLSKEFSMNNPGKLLEGLLDIANVYIVHQDKLHAKVFMFYTSERIYVYHGSANFTRGGLEDNLELTHEFSSTNVSRLENFINHCKIASDKVTKELISKYKGIDQELEKLTNANLEISRKINEIFVDEKDLFKESDYDLDGWFFNYQDYETLFPKHQYQDGPIINRRRDNVRKKLLEINNHLKNNVKQYNLHNHWASGRNPEFITSQIIRSDYNHNRLSWICVRYGKDKKNAILKGSPAERYESFIKHACIQVSLVGDGVQVGLFHATANGAIDRDYLKRNIERLKEKIIYEVTKLNGEKFVWHVFDPKTDKSIKSFSFDYEDPNEFIEFYKKYDDEGFESFCIFHMNPNDQNLMTKDSIVRIASHKIEKLYSLYKLITWVIPD
ncbi:MULTISPECIES: phospholipase D family protein [unclassified Bacillus (in: firmicutes)]|uniref:phospholipase D family protein n=1 Tax=unclassified Bacillus (in: firmicutes) TaxID=185979 RepID=UPI0008EDFE33|nr:MULTISPECIES: phospholipase D family protein [unclassified Bacillus (in: firmicutes)]SFA86417.1 hypothetical protein SAMN02799634_102123 [Bacillus sp. UNCCL13]SFQ83689.1 hypothetical protein SAMN04488577_2243 [Bacillus sp. cl95]